MKRLKFFASFGIVVLFTVWMNLASDNALNAHAAPDAGRWDKRFNSPLLEGRVYASAVAGDTIYIGGDFNHIAGIAVKNIAKWDSVSQTWSALGEGLGGNVYAITVIGEDVYVGGKFHRAGGVSLNHLAKWNGTVWSDVGNGVSGGACAQCISVDALASNGTDLYVGGTFEQAGDVAAINVAMWNGSAWSAFGDGLGMCAYCPASVFALAVYDDAVFAAGSFTAQLAQWNGTSWSTFAHTGFIRALHTQGSDLYAGGTFTEIDGVLANRVARWDGNAWYALGEGLDDYVTALASDGVNLYVGGGFHYAGGMEAQYLAQWNGNAWSDLDIDHHTGVSTLVLLDSLLYVPKQYIGNWRMEVWNGNAWTNLAPTGGMGAAFGIRALENVQGDIYAAGPRLVLAGNTPVQGLARWDGAQWHVVEGAPPRIETLTHNETDLYVGGQFGNGLNSIARWDGTAWMGVGDGVTKNAQPGHVLAMAWQGDDLIVAGNFDHAGAVPVRNIARWDGTNWHALGGGIYGKVSALAVQRNNIYVGGKFPRAGNVFTSGIAKWNGKRWTALGDGLRGGYSRVNALALDGDRLYAGGQFERSGTTNLSNIAVWNGSKWNALGKGLTLEHAHGSVRALAVQNGNLYAGGFFNGSGTLVLEGVAQWDGGKWLAFGGVKGGTVEAFAFEGADVYIGGSFSRVGKRQSSNIALWHPD